jgi:hypothetical protein
VGQISSRAIGLAGVSESPRTGPCSDCRSSVGGLPD